MTGTKCDLFTLNQSRSYLNHLVSSSCDSVHHINIVINTAYFSDHHKHVYYSVAWIQVVMALPVLINVSISVTLTISSRRQF
jgi:hypothetical protein